MLAGAPRPKRAAAGEGSGEQQEPPMPGSAGAGKPRPRAQAAAGGSALPGLELAEARRRLLEAEARRRLVLELESRVQQLHRVLVQAELRLAGRAESLARLGSGAGQAQLRLAAHGQRLKRSLRRSRKARPPALLASALGGCVPWAAGRLRRGRGGAAPEPPESPFKRSPPGQPPA
nr:TMF-regulated nuclear protein 1 [Caretta caretta]